MKFNLHRDPSNKLQKIPYSVMQIAGLADREDLTIQTDEGCILLSHDHLSTRETIQTATLLKQVTVDLMRQLVEASQEMASQPEEREDPLNQFDETMIEALVDCGADPDGLRMLLVLEESEDE
ncbi:hypothetical protein [Pseudoflavonifractor capillosus]|uniref:hypothetical protein n=1 Tax=Pseudoflavonifractor capillosus TaxID=106588 RepID=UPI0019584213|nr:hypothetical protein [Pseudoflavonifractor capillosus]MBM6682175.1 hypothetical protein [Pseudoflavonifractor capillosus]